MQRRPLLLAGLVLALSLSAAWIYPRWSYQGWDPHPGDVRQLTGRWQFRLEARGRPEVRGVVTLRPQPARDSVGVAVPFPGALQGDFTVTALGWLGHPVRDTTAEAFVGDDGRVLLTLHVNGPCSDCGNVELFGPLRDGRMRGRWSREVLSDLDAPSGRATLEPAP